MELFLKRNRLFSLVAWLPLCMLLAVCYAEVGEDNAISSPDQAWLNSLFYLPKEVRVRKEYRTLSGQERESYHMAFIKLKEDTSVTPNKYDLLVSLHGRRSSRNSAHKGTGFLGWHRIFTLLMENALREKVPNVTLPYWDCTLDAVLPEPRMSSLWTEDFLGNGDGYVVNGAFKSWTTQQGKLYRTVGIREGPLEDRNISRLFEHVYVGNISLPLTSSKDIEHVLEETHNRLHRWVGGEMKAIETAAEDPVFYIYHSFINYIWEDFRAHQRAHGVDPETDWDIYYGQIRHHKYSPMGIGNLMAYDGASEIFAENIVYTVRPSCSRQKTDCETPLLYCNVTVEKCVPWTINEYKEIKSIYIMKNTTFMSEAKTFIQLKLSQGFQELHGPVTELTTQNYVDHNHDHDDEFDGLDSYIDSEDEHDHNKHDHENKQVLKDVEDVLKGYTFMIILGCILFIRVTLCTCRKCRIEREKRVRSTCRKYNMDGIANRNYVGDNGKIDEHVPSENRSDNIYTITVTCPDNSTVGNSTYVRFSRYIIGASGGKDKKQVMKSAKTVIPQRTEKGETEEDSPELKCQTDSDMRTEHSRHNVTTRPNDDYMDMTFALNISESGRQNTADIFESEADPSDTDGEDGEARLNSIENENFELPIETTENSFAFLDDYDNVYFTREADIEKLDEEFQEPESERF